MGVARYSYEALSPLPLTSSPTAAAVAASATATTVNGVEDTGEYIVFRNEISLTSQQPASVNLPAPDFFSLDVAGDDDVSDDVVFAPDSSPVVVENEAEVERTVESGWFRSDCRFKSAMLQLHKEILDFCNFLSPTREEEASRMAAIERISDVIRYIWPKCKVEVFGSYKTRLYLPSSDIDIVIMDSDIKTPQIGLQALAKALSQKCLAKKIQVIGKARVPIIKFVEMDTNVSFDISFDLENGPKAAEYIKDAISRLPPLRPLCLILKVFLQQRELNEVYSGGVGSYALLAMLIALFRSLNESQRFPEKNLGILLVKFFELYAHKLNTWDVGVSCTGRQTFFLKNSKGFQTKGRPFLICIEDPQAPENDIGKSSFNYFQIRSAFMMAYSTLTNTKTIMNLGHGKSILGTIIRPDPVLFERKGGSKGELTFNKLLPGAGELLDTQYDENQDVLYNWRSDTDDYEEPPPPPPPPPPPHFDSSEYEEPPLPRGGGGGDGSNGIVENAGASTSGKKRKTSKAASSGKVAENGKVGKHMHEENGSSKRRKDDKKRPNF